MVLLWSGDLRTKKTSNLPRHTHVHGNATKQENCEIHSHLEEGRIEDT